MKRRDGGLRQSTELGQQVFENSHDAILIVDPSADEIVDANPAANDVLGYSRDELLSSALSDLHPDDLDRFRSFVDSVFEDGEGWTDELTCQTKDRGRIQAEISASRIEYEGRPVMLAIIRDVTDREEREEFQRRLYEITADPDRTFDEKLRAVIELGCERYDVEHGGIARVDPADNLFEVEVISGEHDYLVPGEQYPLSETYCTLASADGETTVVTDPVNKGFEGKLCYERFGVQTYLGTHLELDGEVDRTFFFVSNESRDEEFSEADQTFHHLMGEWVRKELQRERRETELQRKNERLENFASLLAHELRNPVNIGQIYSQQLPSEEAPDAVEYVAEAFDRIEEMIDVMLVLTRGREAVGERTPVHLGDSAREAWDEVDTSDATLEIAVDRTIRADEAYVRHLFQNLLENAVEHGSTSSQPEADDAVEHGSASPRSQAHEDAVEHGSTSNRPEADDAIEHGGPDVTVTVGELPTGFYVEDDGAGIPDDEREVVFDQGYTTASENGGLGLGLAFVRKLAEVYDWECAVTESAAGGARFEFTNVGPQ